MKCYIPEVSVEGMVKRLVGNVLVVVVS